MVTDVISDRESIGRFCPRARTAKNKRRLSLFNLVCFSLFFKHVILALRIAIVLYFVFSPSTCIYRPANYESRPGHGRLATTDHASIITFLLCVLCILLLISGIEPNPGPGTDDSFSCSKFY
jgi:hypothetical protein